MKLIILDRDGVINHDSLEYIKTPDEWIPIPGSLDAIARLHQHGYTIAVATNQSGIARGYYSLETLNKIHSKMLTLVKQAGGEIAHIEFCPHLPDAGCACRKPKPGMLLSIAQHFGVTLKGVPYLGDRKSDIESGLAANAQPVLISTEISPPPGIPRFASLENYVNTLLTA